MIRGDEHATGSIDCDPMVHERDFKQCDVICRAVNNR